MPNPRTPDPGWGGDIGGTLADVFTGSLGAGLGWGDDKQVQTDLNNANTGIAANGAQAADALGFTSLLDALNAVRAWIGDRHNWVRVAYFMGGVTLFSFGVAAVVARPAAAAAAPIVSAIK